MTRERRIDAPPRPGRERLLPREDRVPSAPAEPDHADFVRAREVPDLIEEALDDGAGDGLAVPDEPWAERGADLGGGGGFLRQGLGGAGRERGFDGLQEGGVEGVAGVDVGDVGGEAGGGVFVGAGRESRSARTHARVPVCAGMGGRVGPGVD